MSTYHERMKKEEAERRPSPAGSKARPLAITDPEIEAMRTAALALADLPAESCHRALDWLNSYFADVHKSQRAP